MEEHAIRQNIKNACFEPRAPEELVSKVILRAQAVTMGAQAQKQLDSAPAEKLGQLASRVVVGQLASVSELPGGVSPEQLAAQLERQPEFKAALMGGNVVRRLNSGELMRQITGQQPAATRTEPSANKPVEKSAPTM